MSAFYEPAPAISPSGARPAHICVCPACARMRADELLFVRLLYAMMIASGLCAGALWPLF